MDLAVKNYKPLLILIPVVVTLISIYLIVSGYIISQNTGILDITVPSGSSVAIYRPGYEVTNIGSNKSKIRLSPASYSVIVTGSSQVTKLVYIHKKQTTNLSVNSLPINSSVDKNAKANNLIKLLPIIGPAANYEINYKYTYTNNVASPIIIITAANSNDEQLALQWITSRGFNLNGLTINYIQQVVENYHYTNGLP